MEREIQFYLSEQSFAQLLQHLPSILRGNTKVTLTQDSMAALDAALERLAEWNTQDNDRWKLVGIKIGRLNDGRSRACLLVEGLPLN